MTTPRAPKTRPVNKPDLVVDGVTTRKRSSVREVTLFFDDTVNGDSYNSEREAAPLGWVNFASVAIDPDDDAVTLSISVGDPRGAFTFTVRRLQDGRLIMHVPHPDDPLLHAPLREDHPGTYDIG